MWQQLDFPAPSCVCFAAAVELCLTRTSYFQFRSFGVSISLRIENPHTKSSSPHSPHPPHVLLLLSLCLPRFATWPAIVEPLGCSRYSSTMLHSPLHLSRLPCACLSLFAFFASLFSVCCGQFCRVPRFWFARENDITRKHTHTRTHTQIERVCAHKKPQSWVRQRERERGRGGEGGGREVRGCGAVPR